MLALVNGTRQAADTGSAAIQMLFSVGRKQRRLASPERKTPGPARRAAALRREGMLRVLAQPGESAGEEQRRCVVCMFL